MPLDPYEALGVARDATAAQVRSAYLKLAKKLHPDHNPGDKKAEERFKAINTANDLLSDPEKRARFDRGEIDASGQERVEPQFRRGRGQPGRGPDAAAFQDIFSDLFRGGMPGGGMPGGMPGGMNGANAEAARMRGQDQRYRLDVGFAEAAQGAQRRLTLPDGRSLDVTIPVGLEDGQTLRLRGQGGAGWNGAPAGDALIEVSVQPHPYFSREGNDIHLELPVTVAEAVLGAKVAVPTLSGSVSLSVPRHSDAGRQLRLRGRGIPAHAGRPAGDLYVTLKVVIGTPDEALEEALRVYAEHNPADPRRGMAEAA